MQTQNTERKKQIKNIHKHKYNYRSLTQNLDKNAQILIIQTQNTNYFDAGNRAVQQ